MKSKSFVAGLIIAVLVIIATGADYPNTSESTTSTTAQKVYAIFTNSGLEDCVIKEVSRETFLDIPCLKGIQCADTWARGKVVRVPIDHIAMIIEFASENDYTSSANRAKK